MAEQKRNPFVGIAGVIGGISVAIVAVMAILAKDQFWAVPWVVGALALMGMVLGFFASKAPNSR